MATRPQMQRRLVLVSLAVTVVVVVAVIGMLLWPRDRAHVVSLDEVVDNYRASTIASDTAAPDTPAPDTAAADTTAPATGTVSVTTAPTVPSATSTLVEPGVYRYATSGWEDVDALDGARHEYPAETTITVTAEGCGVRLRWDALRERRDEWRLCVTERGIERQPDAIQYHDFFQTSELNHFDCDRSVVVVPNGDPPAEPVVQSCLLRDNPWVATWTVVERTTRTVDGTEVPVWHMRMTVDDNDEHWEHTTTDWLVDDHGLPIAVTSTKETNSPSPIGDVRYRETLELSIRSLEPLR